MSSIMMPNPPARLASSQEAGKGLTTSRIRKIRNPKSQRNPIREAPARAMKTPQCFIDNNGFSVGLAEDAFGFACGPDTDEKESGCQDNIRRER